VAGRKTVTVKTLRNLVVGEMGEFFDRGGKKSLRKAYVKEDSVPGREKERSLGQAVASVVGEFGLKTGVSIRGVEGSCHNQLMEYELFRIV